ncbi:MAG TPA: hypothetical protein VFW19_08855 [Allosphingosinicella sp.]|nr:hypothetical protein [Allosphingosinicella sp.]
MRPFPMLLFAFLSLGAAPAPRDGEIDYAIRPVVEGAAIVALDVTATLQGDRSGTTKLTVPDRAASASDLWHFIKDLRVDGAASVAEDGPGMRIVRAAPGTPLTVHYRLVSAFDHDPTQRDVDTYLPAIRPTWFWAYGESLFVYPDGGHWTARVRWQSEGFPIVSDLDHQAGRPMSIDALLESVSVGGPAVRLRRTAIAGAPLRIASIGTLGFTDAEFTAAVTRIVTGERRFWGGREGPFLVVVAALGGTPRGTNIRGDGRGDAFAIQTTPNAPLADLVTLLAHEYFHTWNPARLGGIAGGAREAEDYWFSEGFTDYYARRLLLRMGGESLDSFVADWNKALTEYAGSPVRLAPNTAIAARFWQDGDVHNLPYLRGAIMAARWDAALRRASRGRYGLDDVMRAMRAAAKGSALKAPDLFVATARRFGLDMAAERRSVIEKGNAALLPADAFGGCLRVTNIDVPKFDHGFDFRATLGNGGKVVGLEPGGPAERAGLREGMEIGIDEALSNDSRKPLTYTHRKADGTVERITFLPQGRETTTLQQIAIPPGLTPAQRRRCAAEASGAASGRRATKS